jgi:hypothetical protein
LNTLPSYQGDDFPPTADKVNVGSQLSMNFIILSTCKWHCHVEIIWRMLEAIKIIGEKMNTLELYYTIEHHVLLGENKHRIHIGLVKADALPM